MSVGDRADETPSGWTWCLSGRLSSGLKGLVSTGKNCTWKRLYSASIKFFFFFFFSFFLSLFRGRWNVGREKNILGRVFLLYSRRVLSRKCLTQIPLPPPPPRPIPEHSGGKKWNECRKWVICKEHLIGEFSPAVHTAPLRQSAASGARPDVGPEMCTFEWAFDCRPCWSEDDWTGQDVKTPLIGLRGLSREKWLDCELFDCRKGGLFEKCDRL